MPAPIPLRIVALGRRAHASLKSNSRGAIIARFERSLYLRMEDLSIVCVGSSAIGNGPINACCSSDPRPHIANVAVGDEVVRVGDSVRVGEKITLRWTGAKRWSADPPFRPVSAGRLGIRIGLFRDEARKRCPDDGLARLVFRPDDDTETPLLGRGRMGVGALRTWLGDRLSGGTELPPPAVAGLIGLGPGLTPSGDDVLGGAMVALHVLGQGAVASVLSSWLGPQLRRGTSEISAAHLGAAGAGEGAEALHRCLDVLLSEPTGLFGDPLDAIDAIGHTSGWDGLAGIVLAIEAASRGLLMLEPQGSA